LVTLGESVDHSRDPVPRFVPALRLCAFARDLDRPDPGAPRFPLLLATPVLAQLRPGCAHLLCSSATRHTRKPRWRPPRPSARQGGHDSRAPSPPQRGGSFIAHGLSRSDYPGDRSIHPPSPTPPGLHIPRTYTPGLPLDETPLGFVVVSVSRRPRVAAARQPLGYVIPAPSGRQGGHDSQAPYPPQRGGSLMAHGLSRSDYRGNLGVHPSSPTPSGLHIRERTRPACRSMKPRWGLSWFRCPGVPG
jgi:hypothetical protein